MESSNNSKEKPFQTGLDMSYEHDIELEKQLDEHAEFKPDHGYIYGKILGEDKTAEGIVKEAFLNGKIFAAKQRINRASERSVNKFDLIEIYKRFLSEVKIMKACHHKNIAQIYDAYRDSYGDLFIIMDLCEGGDLNSMRTKYVSTDDKTEVKLMIDILGQIGVGLNHLHQNKMCHRDLDPRNIMFKDGVIKLIDFGFSIMLNSMTQFVQTHIGKFFYAAPEVF